MNILIISIFIVIVFMEKNEEEQKFAKLNCLRIITLSEHGTTLTILCVYFSPFE